MGEDRSGVGGEFQSWGVGDRSDRIGMFSVSLGGFASLVQSLLTAFQADPFQKARAEYESKHHCMAYYSCNHIQCCDLDKYNAYIEAQAGAGAVQKGIRTNHKSAPATSHNHANLKKPKK